MKKMTLFSAVLSIVGFVSAQSVSSSDFVTNIAKYNGTTVSISDVKGKIRVNSASTANTTATNTKAPTSASGSTKNAPTAIAANPLNSNANNTPTKGSTTVAPKNTVNQSSGSSNCTAPTGYKIVDFSFQTGANVGCFLIPTNLVNLFNQVTASGKKMGVYVTVDTKTNLHKIKSIVEQ